MNLEELNKEYVQLKKDLETNEQDIETLKTKLNDLADDKTIQKGKLVEAKRNGDPVAEKAAQDEIKRIDDEIKAIAQTAKDKQKTVKDLQTKINERVEQIKQNPEMKKHLEEVMAKKYDRKLSKLEKEREEVSGKKDRLENLQKLVTEHPALGNNLKGVLVAQKEITDLEKELDGLKISSNGGPVQYKDPARANEIMNKLLPDAKSKLATNKTPLMTYINKKGLNITEQDLDELASKGFVVDGKGNINLNATINKSVSAYNRQIKGYDKSISDHQIALENLGRTHTTKTPKSEKTTGSRDEEGPEDEEKPKQKWYQKIAQKFRDWNEKRKQKALPEASEKKKEESGHDFRDSMKYKIVQDIVKDMETDGRKVAKEIRKSERQSDGDER